MSDATAISDKRAVTDDTSRKAIPRPTRDADTILGSVTTDDDAGEAATEIDCAPVGEALIAWLEAAFSAASTSVTNAEMAAAWDEALAKTQQAPDPGGEMWPLHIDMLEKNAAEWHALPPNDGALENVDAVAESVEDYAESIGYDYDLLADGTALVGEQCAAELQDMLDE